MMAPSWLDARGQLQLQATKLDRHAKLVVKQGWFWTTVAWLLFIVTFGAFNRQAFLDRFATTIGPYIAIPASWSAEAVQDLLAHEARHVTQSRWFGFGIHPLIGVPFMALAYLLLPLPLGLSWVRFRLELDADVASWKALKQAFPLAARDAVMPRAIRFSETVSSAAYGWAWPKTWCKARFVAAAEKVLAA